MESNRTILLGGGGHAHSCYSLAKRLGFELLGFRDDSQDDPRVFDLDHLGEIKGLEEEVGKDIKLIMGIGDHDQGKSRRRIWESLISLGYTFSPLVSDRSNFLDHFDSTKKVQVFDQVYFGPGCILGENSIFNTSCIVEHQCKVGDHCHIGPGTVLSGNILLGDQVLIGANSTILPGVEINSGNIIGAGSVVPNSIHESSGIYVGNPAKKIADWEYSL